MSEVSKESDEKMNRYFFEVVFPTCNSFRQILQFLNQFHKTVPLVFTKNSLHIRKENDKKNCIFEGTVFSRNLLKYYVDPNEIRGDREYVVHVPIGPFLNNLKKIQKKQEVRICRTKKNPENIQIILDDSGSRYAEIRVDPCKTKPPRLNVENPRPSDDPNITMKLSSFNLLTETAGSSSDRKIKLAMYDRGVQITSASLHGGSVSLEGDCDGEKFAEIEIPTETMKSLVKLASLCEEGIVRMYCADESHIRLEIPISVIGTICLYIIDK